MKIGFWPRVVEKIGTTEALIRFQSGQDKATIKVAEILNHKSAVEECLNLLRSGDAPLIGGQDKIGVVGHRVVYGGEKFSGSQLMTEPVVEEIRECIELAPLHNPHNLNGYQVCRQLLPEVPQVAVFDTAFHQTMPPPAYLYGLPYLLYRRHQTGDTGSTAPLIASSPTASGKCSTCRRKRPI